ncbi:MAG: hypothetical protein AAFQ98_06705, partial [Bacteroidota bacterium]
MTRILSLGIGAIVIGLVILTSYTGVTIDYQTGRIRHYSSICGFKSGAWEDLPNIYSVEVISDTYTSTDTPNGVSPTLSGKVTDYKIILCRDDGGQVVSFEYTKKIPAVQNSKGLAE